MPEFLIQYQTENNYSEEMRHALLDFLILPENNNTQERLSYSIEVSPPVSEFITQNSFGFDILQFRLDSEHRNFKVRLTANIQKEETNPFSFNYLSSGDELLQLNSHDFEIDNYPFVLSSSLTQLPVTYSCPEINKEEHIFDFINRVNDFVHRAINYDDSIINPQRLISETLDAQSGVCQDYAHLMLAILRANKIPARYVSGYLNQGSEFIGAAAIHAWVQANIPGVGWVGFDPTNNLVEDYNYIKIAHGLDINDCHNVKGVVAGPGNNETNYEVLVHEQNRKENQ